MVSFLSSVQGFVQILHNPADKLANAPGLKQAPPSPRERGAGVGIMHHALM